MDMNGDGRLDIVAIEPGAVWKVYLGVSGGVSTTAITWGTAALPSDYDDWMQKADSSGDVFRSDVMDITGDGIPDFIDARLSTWSNNNNQWKVYPGGCSSATSCSFGPAIDWASPVSHLRIIGSSKTSRDLVDLNGDGRVDLVDGFNKSFWDVHWNTGAGFAPNADAAYAQSGPVGDWNTSNGSTATSRALFDFNGDGLTDLVESPKDQLAAVDGSGNILSIFFEGGDCSMNILGQMAGNGCSGPSGTVNYAAVLSVRLNTGNGFDPWPIYSILETQAVSLNNDKETRTDFLDVNADGLPDYVVGHSLAGDGNFAVGRWDQPRRWNDREAGGPDGAPTPVDFQRPWQYITGSIRWAAGESKRGRTGSQFEIYSTGTAMAFLDRVTTQPSVPGGAWTIEYGGNVDGEAIQRPFLLVHIDDGARGETEIRYAPSTDFDNGGADGAPDLPSITWVTTGIRRTDGLCTAAPTPPAGTVADLFDPAHNPCIGQGHESVEEYDYADGFFDSDAQEFRGFGTVTTVRPDGSSYVTTFSQADHTRGKILSAETFGAGSSEVVHRVTNLWATKQSTLDSVRTQVYLEETREESFAIPHAAGTTWCALDRNEPPDDYGRVVRTCSMDCQGAPATPGSCANPPARQVETVTSWADPPTGSAAHGAKPAFTSGNARVQERWRRRDCASAENVLLRRRTTGHRSGRYAESRRLPRPERDWRGRVA